MNIVFHEESFILAEKTQSAGIANSLTGESLGEIIWKSESLRKFMENLKSETKALISNLQSGNLLKSDLKNYYRMVMNNFDQIVTLPKIKTIG